MINNRKTKQAEIIKWLKQFGRLPTSRLIGLTGINLEYIKKYLEELELEGIIIREEETNATYWVLKKEDKDE